MQDSRDILGRGHMAEPARPGLERCSPSHVVARRAHESREGSSHPFSFDTADSYQRVRHGRPPSIQLRMGSRKRGIISISMKTATEGTWMIRR
jgi:hypothetical protein